MSFLSEDSLGSNSMRRQFLRGGLFAFLSMLFFGSSFLAWQSLFSVSAMGAIMWGSAAMAGLWGTWRLFIAERQRANAQAVQSPDQAAADID